MTTLQKILIGATVALCVGVSVHQAFQASQLRDQVGAMQRERDAAAEEGRKLREANDALQRKLAGMQADLQTAQEQKSEPPAAKPDPAVDAMVEWMDRVDRLKQRLKEHPEASIPEIQWLTEQDWLNAAHNKLDTDNDYRRALSNLRSSAENRFELKAFPALQKYLNEHDGKFPTDLAQLQPYFESPIDPAVLEHWKIAAASDVPNISMGGDWIITQKAAVDEEYDSIMGMGPRGYGSAGSGFDPALKELQAVGRAYMDANPGREPTGMADLLPYATTPEQRAALTKQMEMQEHDPKVQAITSVLKAYVAANPGRFPKDLSELMPYATTAEQQAALKEAQGGTPGKM